MNDIDLSKLHEQFLNDPEINYLQKVWSNILVCDTPTWIITSEGAEMKHSEHTEREISKIKIEIDKIIKNRYSDLQK